MQNCPDPGIERHVKTRPLHYCLGKRRGPYIHAGLEGARIAFRCRLKRRVQNGQCAPPLKLQLERRRIPERTLDPNSQYLLTFQLFFHRRLSGRGSHHLIHLQLLSDSHVIMKGIKKFVHLCAVFRLVA